MTESTSLPVSQPYLDFGSPLSAERANGLAARLARSRPATVVDIGCGWGELLMRVLAAAPGSIGVGIDTDADDIARARGNAETNGLGGRVTFRQQSAADHGEPADLVVCVGSSHAFGDTATALRRLRPLVNPGGRLLFGEVYWQRRPTDRELANMWDDASVDEHTDLPELCDLAVAAGFLPLWVETTNRDEWEHFESGFIAGEAEWLMHNGGTDKAAEVRARVNRFRDRFLRGYRDVLGFAYLTLGVPVERATGRNVPS